MKSSKRTERITKGLKGIGRVTGDQEKISGATKKEPVRQIDGDLN